MVTGDGSDIVQQQQQQQQQQQNGITTVTTNVTQQYVQVLKFRFVVFLAKRLNTVCQ